ncbi:hypothetical protein FRC02_001297, partial [Tulasnella sp. 418]
MHLTTIATTALLAAFGPKVIRGAPVAQGGNGGNAYTGPGGNADGGSIIYGSNPGSTDNSGTASVESFDQPSAFSNLGNPLDIDILHSLTGTDGNLLSGSGLLDLDILDGITNGDLLSLDILGLGLGQSDEEYDTFDSTSYAESYGESYPHSTETNSGNGGTTVTGNAQGGNGGDNVVVNNESVNNDAANTGTNGSNNPAPSDQPASTESVAQPAPESANNNSGATESTNSAQAEVPAPAPANDPSGQGTAASDVGPAVNPCTGGNGGNAYT